MEQFLIDHFSLVLGTITLRPYFAAFFLTYIFACSLHLGLKRMLLFAVAGYIIAWAAEYSSIHNGFPYGDYYYICETGEKELWVLGVPFMDSMSFVFLSYASYSLAVFAVSPSTGPYGVYLLENRKIRHSLKVRLLGALFCMGLDVIIDPVALMGHRWFLGQIYGYAQRGAYFGIPLSNFIGWFIVAFVLIYALQSIDRLLAAKGVKDMYGAALTWRYLPGPALYLGIIAFNLSITLILGEYRLFLAGILIVLVPMALLIVFMKVRLARRDSDRAVKEHLHDFPRAVLPGTERLMQGGQG